MDLSQYQMTEEIGGEGVVYLRNKKTGNPLVLKRSDFSRGLQEVKAYQKLRWSPLVDFAIEPDGVLLLMQRHRGRSLAEHLESDASTGRLIARLDHVLRSSMAALGALHADGVTHGDITPRKVLIDDDGNVQLIGPGSAAEDGDAPSAFTAPEMVFGVGADRELADYYSLGRCLRLLVRGREDAIDYDTIDTIAALSSVIPEVRRDAVRRFSL